MGEIIAGILSNVIGAALFGGSSGKADKMIDSQARLSDAATNIFQRQANQDLPYRKNMYDALVKRSRRQFPRILPQQPSAPLNPMAGGARPSYSGMNEGSRSQNFGSILKALTQGRQQEG